MNEEYRQSVLRPADSIEQLLPVYLNDIAGLPELPATDKEGGEVEKPQYSPYNLHILQKFRQILLGHYLQTFGRDDLTRLVGIVRTENQHSLS